MKERLIFGFAVLVFFIAAGCTKDSDVPAEEKFVRVSLNISADDAMTRASNPMVPANENLIYGLWVLQFDDEGIIIGKPEYYPCNELGVLSTELSPELREGQSTVCLVANLREDFEFKVGDRFVDNITTFRAMLIDAPLITDDVAGSGNIGHLNDRSMYMYGFYQGDIKAGQNLNVLLGRLFLCVRLEFTNKMGKPIDNMDVTLGNVPTKTRIPFVDERPAGNGSVDYVETDVLGDGKLAAGASVTLYYYMPENINPAPEEATYVKVVADGLTADLKLGNDAPSVPDASRDYSLSRNNIYTFKLGLK